MVKIFKNYIFFHIFNPKFHCEYKVWIIHYKFNYSLYIFDYKRYSSCWKKRRGGEREALKIYLKICSKLYGCFVVMKVVKTIIIHSVLTIPTNKMYIYYNTVHCIFHKISVLKIPGEKTRSATFRKVSLFCLKMHSHPI